MSGSSTIILNINSDGDKLVSGHIGKGNTIEWARGYGEETSNPSETCESSFGRMLVGYTKNSV